MKAVQHALNPFFLWNRGKGFDNNEQQHYSIGVSQKMRDGISGHLWAGSRDRCLIRAAHCHHFSEVYSWKDHSCKPVKLPGSGSSNKMASSTGV